MLSTIADYEIFVYSLRDTFPSIPHHKHVPPDIKHHHIPAPGLSFTRPNLPFLIEEIERQVLQPPEV